MAVWPVVRLSVGHTGLRDPVHDCERGESGEPGPPLQLAREAVPGGATYYLADCQTLKNYAPCMYAPMRCITLP